MLSRAPALLLVVLLALAAPALGCGSREQLVGLPELADAGGAPDARPDATVCREDGLPCRGAADCCSAACSRGICGGGNCAQDGAPCDAPGDCCTGLCAEGICGQGCSVDGGCAGACSPDGSGCNAGADCCSRRCNAGVCGGCSPDGRPCAGSDECCDGNCQNGLCGGPACRSDGTACGGCVAESCCAQLNQCLTSLACAEDVACFFGCLDEGNGPAVCGFECMNSPETFQLLRCVGRSCGGGACF
ncbi:hypothetical protein WMF28_08530 [Sorangium sp. So ce590]|uniref:hypothetical protein n=1 Tax=Sorangium sp. So ce590 TaxID=3133317 RepID=UPI003F5FA18A